VTRSEIDGKCRDNCHMATVSCRNMLCCVNPERPAATTVAKLVRESAFELRAACCRAVDPYLSCRLHGMHGLQNAGFHLQARMLAGSRHIAQHDLCLREVDIILVRGLL